MEHEIRILSSMIALLFNQLHKNVIFSEKSDWIDPLATVMTEILSEHVFTLKMQYKPRSIKFVSSKRSYIFRFAQDYKYQSFILLIHIDV